GDVIEEASSFWLRASGSDKGDARGSSIPAPLGEEERRELVARLSAALERSGSTALTLMTIPQYGADASLVADILAAQGIPLDIKLLPAEQFKGGERMEADLLLFAIMLDEYRELRLVDLYMSMLQHMAETDAGAMNSWL